MKRRKTLRNIRLNLKDVKRREIELFASRIKVIVEKNGEPAICPYCHTPSTKVYEYRKQLILDKPKKGRRVEVELNKRRFVCINQHCSVKTFTERIEGLSSSGRYTQAFEEFLKELISKKGYARTQKYLLERYNLRLSLTTLFYLDCKLNK